jgi:hypothetical protein
MMSQQKQRDRDDKNQKKYFESIQVTMDKKEIQHQNKMDKIIQIEKKQG